MTSLVLDVSLDSVMYNYLSFLDGAIVQMFDYFKLNLEILRFLFLLLLTSCKK